MPPLSSNVPLGSEPSSSAGHSDRSTSMGQTASVSNVSPVVEHHRLFNYAGARPRQSEKRNLKKKHVSQCSLNLCAWVIVI